MSALPEHAPTEADRTWFFKLFSLRGIRVGEEQMCFFAFLQKTDDTNCESGSQTLTAKFTYTGYDDHRVHSIEAGRQFFEPRRKCACG